MDHFFIYYIIYYTVPYYYNNNNLEYTNRILSTINACTLSIFSILVYCQLLDISYLYNAINYSIGWFTTDIFYMITHYHKSNNLYYIHHILTLSLIFTDTVLLVPKDAIVIIFMTEITTPLMNLAWYLHKEKLLEKYKNMALLLYITIIFSWIYFRIYNLILLYYIKTDVIYHCYMSVYLIANIYWLYKILLKTLYMVHISR